MKRRPTIHDGRATFPFETHSITGKLLTPEERAAVNPDVNHIVTQQQLNTNRTKTFLEGLKAERARPGSDTKTVDAEIARVEAILKEDTNGTP